MLNSELGEVKISKDVIMKIARLAVSEIESVSNYSHENSKKIYTKAPKIEIEENKVKVYVTVSFYYGSDIRQEVIKVQENVKESIENMTALTVEEVNVYIYDITPKEEN